METQEAERRLLIGRGPGEDRGEERVEELDGLTAGDEDDELVVLGELNHKQSVSLHCCTESTNQDLQVDPQQSNSQPLPVSSYQTNIT